MEAAMSSTSFSLKSKIIQAGAGAGKTTNLIRTFVDNVKSFKQYHSRYPRVVISTFTRKATQELKERLYAQALKENDQELFDYLNKKSWIHISTLHGLLVPFLSRYGSKAGLNPEIKIISNTESEKNLKRLVKKAFEKKSELIDLLDYLSWSDIATGLLQVYENSILFDEFNWDSAEGLKVKSASMFKNLKNGHREIQHNLSTTATSKSWIAYAEVFSQSFEDFESLKNWREAIPRKPAFSEAKPSLDPAVHEELLQFIDLVDDTLDQPLLNPEYWPDFEKIHRLFRSLSEEVIPAFIKSKMETGKITMSDLEVMTVKVLKEWPDTGSAFAQEWDYWMVDEYQDTSPVQVFILSHFIQKQPHFIVGDPQQSIYLFRGARSEVFHSKIQEIETIGGQFDHLEKNYRSRQELVSFFNFVFPKINETFTNAQFGSEKNSPHVPAAHITILPPDEEDQKYSNEVRTVLAQVKSLLESGVKAEKIAILSRKNSVLDKFVQCAKEYKIPVQCPSVSNYWRKREILDLIGLTSFLLNSYNYLSLLSLFRSPWFFVSDDKIFDIVKLNKEKSLIWSSAVKLSESDEELRKPIQVLQNLKETSLTLGISAALIEFLKISDFLKADRYIDPTGRREANIWKFITDLKTQEKKPGQNIIEFVDAILESENLDVDQAEQDAAPIVEPNRVTLMTIHASKGLQFEHVFVVGLGSDSQAAKNHLFTFDEEEKIFSISLRNEDNKLLASPVAQAVTEKMRKREAEESWRVFYVALTRAQESLWLSATEDARKNTWIKTLPINLEEGDHSIEGAFYRVQKLVMAPEVGEILSTQNTESKIQPLSFSEEITNATKKSSVTSSLSMKPVNQKQNLVGKAMALEKAQFGTMAHKVFESLAIRKGQKFTTDDNLQSALDFIYEIQDPPMQDILKTGLAEWGFSVRIDEKILQGSIDLWAELPDAVYILDYKTGSSAYSDSAFEQMTSYSNALKKMGACSPNKPHILVAIYPFESKVLQKKI
jgi:ATP-dependent helicase/nuclease subunit A